MNLTIRILTVADVPAAMELELQSFSLPWTEGMLRGELADSSCIYYGAFDGAVLAGYAGMRYVLDEGYVNNVAVLPTYRRTGIARALLAALDGAASQLGLSFLTLEARESNVPAISLYSSHGYVPVGCRPSYYEQPVEDAVLMTKYFT